MRVETIGHCAALRYTLVARIHVRPRAPGFWLRMDAGVVNRDVSPQNTFVLYAGVANVGAVERMLSDDYEGCERGACPTQSPGPR